MPRLLTVLAVLALLPVLLAALALLALRRPSAARRIARDFRERLNASR